MELYNCAALQGNRDNIDSMASGSQKVLGQVLKLIDLYDLYGSVAYPKASVGTRVCCGNFCS
jgi:sucrose-phosphate synthase